MNREDFKILENNIVYFDNGATTLKPSCVRDAIIRYYDEYTQMETSQMLGMSQVQVSRNEAKILQKLKTRL